jgi:transcriptional regulator with XRE-family HTH domain
MQFKDRVKELRRSRGWSQQDFASKIGIGQSGVAGYESGRKIASPDNLIKISKLFGVSLDYLLGVSDEKIVYHSGGQIKDPDLIHLTNLVRPKLNGISVTDDQWKMITTFLEMVAKNL